MDARITKKRISENLQYDWIKIIIFIVIAIVVWELIFTTTSVRVKTGQNFKVYYYSSIDSTSTDAMYEVLNEENVLSYDVLEKNIETLTSKYESTILSARMATAEGDMMIIDNILTKSEIEAKKEDTRCSSSNFKSLADSYDFYDYDLLLKDAESYLDNFMTEGNIDDAKIEAIFRKRMKKDNRFRKEKDILKGIEQEKNRIIKLQKEVKAFKYILDTYGDSYGETAGDNKGLFYKYVKYEYSYFNELSEEDYKNESEKESFSCAGGDSTSTSSTYEKIYKQNKEKGAKKYAINVEFLSGGNKEISDLCKLASSTEVSVQDIMISVFNFKEKQEDLQYEVISVINQIIREYSNLFNGYLE